MMLNGGKMRMKGE